MSDDRASRLRERRRSSKSRAERATEPTESPQDGAGPDGQTLDDDGAERATGSNATADDTTTATVDDGSTGSVKEEQVGTYMYLPESQKRELSRVFNVTKAEYEYEYEQEFEKNRHFYPLLVQFGVETLDDASASEIRDLLADLDST